MKAPFVALLLPLLAECAHGRQGSDVASFNIHVIHTANDPRSVQAKDLLKATFCDTFGVSPCEPDSLAEESELHLKDDFVVNAPDALVQQVLAFFQQRRIARLNAPAKVDLDLVFYPNTGSENDFDLGIWAGARHPVDMNRVYRQGGGAPVRANQNLVMLADNDEDQWAYTCSSDASGEGKWVDLCSTGPFAPTTTCRANPLGAHLHLYNWAMNSEDTSAKKKFQELVSASLGIPDDICHDNYGHEEPHNASCWLGGPNILPPGLSEQPGPPGGGSFVTGHYSIYIVNDDFARIVGWVLQNNVPEVMGKEIDYLLHPCYGCNFADHQEWALFNGDIPNNLAGIEESGDWQGTAPPRLDPFGPLAANKCGCADPSATSYNLHMLYDPTDSSEVSAKDQVLSKLTSAFSGVQVVDEAPYSFKDANSPFLAGQVHLKLEVAESAAVMDWLSTERGSVDVLLVPETCCGMLADYTQNSIWAGRTWPLNKAALVSAVPRAFSKQFLHKPERSSNLEVAHDYMLYVNYAAANKWQSAAAETFLSMFASEFNLTRKECATWYPPPESQESKLCMMNEVASPTSSSAMLISYGSIYIPKADVARVLSWAATHRSAEMLGYDVDLVWVPLTGDATSDYTVRAFHAGTAWPVNGPALINDPALVSMV